MISIPFINNLRDCTTLTCETHAQTYISIPHLHQGLPLRRKTNKERAHRSKHIHCHARRSRTWLSRRISAWHHETHFTLHLFSLEGFNLVFKSASHGPPPQSTLLLWECVPECVPPQSTLLLSECVSECVCSCAAEIPSSTSACKPELVDAGSLCDSGGDNRCLMLWCKLSKPVSWMRPPSAACVGECLALSSCPPVLCQDVSDIRASCTDVSELSDNSGPWTSCVDVGEPSTSCFDASPWLWPLICWPGRFWTCVWVSVERPPSVKDMLQCSTLDKVAVIRALFAWPDTQRLSVSQLWVGLTC
jgi:hypothetical protein